MRAKQHLNKTKVKPAKIKTAYAKKAVPAMKGKKSPC